jgi:hypothetical protein
MRRLTRKRRSSGGGFYHLQNARGWTLQGFGDGDFIRLRDQSGNVWRGRMERQPDQTVRYYFRDREGKSATGITDHGGIILRDEDGNTWRGFLD